MKILTVLSLLLALNLPVGNASAHVLEFNNGIGAVLHIDPQDEPIAGQQTSFYFEFSDKIGTFSALDCDCNLQILSADKQELLNAPLYASAEDGASTTYVFPTRDVYTLNLFGKPKNNANFPSFTLNYTVRVDKGEGAPLSQTDYKTRAIYISAGGVALLIVFLLLRSTIVYNVKYNEQGSAPKSRNDDRRKPRKPRI